MGSYQVETTDQARREIRGLPGNVRQRVFRELQELKVEPQPHHSRLLDTGKAAISLPPSLTLHRIRILSWRIIYVIEEEQETITILAVRKRPPYQYEDLENLIEGL